MSYKLFALLSLLLFGHAGFGQETDNPKFARNVVSVTPFFVDIPGEGYGVQYEYFINKKGKLSLCLPVDILYYSLDVKNNTAPSATAGIHTVNDKVVYVMPGIKYYPAGSAHTLSYSIGGSLIYGKRKVLDDDNMEATHNAFGMLVNNTLNIVAARHLYIGAQVGIGIDLETQATQQEVPIFLNVSVSVGYRFNTGSKKK